MGYESKFIFGEVSILPSRMHDGVEYNYVRITAMIDMCKLGDGAIYQVIKNAPPSGCFSYESDGNTPFYKDKYDDPLGEIDPDSLRHAIEQDSETWDYNLYKMLLGMINNFFPEEFFYDPEESETKEKLIILHYGY